MPDATWSAVLGSWEFEPTVVAGLALAAGLYARGLRQLWGRAHVGAAVPAWRAAAFAAGLLAVAFALLSPLAAFSGLLFSAHMAQHLLLTMVGAPLLLLGAPLVPLLWGLPRGVRRMVGQAVVPGAPLHRLFGGLTRPLVAFGLHTLVVWGWHLPPFYNAGLRSDLVHYLQHGLFLGTALLFWWPVIQPTPGRRGLSYGLALLYLAGAMVAQTKLLGAVLTFAGTPIYTHYTEVPRLWGISALADQQVAGLLMLVGGFMMLFLAVGVVFFAWAAEEGRKELRVQPPPGAGAGAPPGSGAPRRPLAANGQGGGPAEPAYAPSGTPPAETPHAAR